MSDSPDQAAPARAKEDPESLVLRGPPRPVVRIRRGLIVTIAGAVAAAVAGISWLAFDPPTAGTAATTLASGDEDSGRSGEDALAGAPGTYGEVPRLGPPLPGDLGGPILDHQRALDEPGGASESAVGSDAQAAIEAAEDERRREEAVQAARSSPLMVEVAGGGPRSQGDGGAAGAGPGGGNESATADSGAGRQLSARVLVPPASPWTVAAGTIIRASLLTGLNSDLPGTVIAQVTHDVLDSATGRTVLIPQGARLIGKYEPAAAYGQSRALVAWTRIVLPDGSSVDLGDMPAADASGYAGLADKVNSHGWRLLKGIALSTLLGIGTELGLGGGGELVRAIRESGERGASESADRIAARNLDIRPTITVRPGWPVQVIVDRDLLLKPWKG
ncbi:MAG: TrbI/VirB10 family protein [Bacillota bacterium]